MFGDTSRSDGSRLALERAVGRARLRFGPRGLAELHQGGAFKVRLPRVAPPEAVLLNTAGGLAGGDRLACAVALDEGARATITTAACEKVYRSDGRAAVLEVRLEARAESRLDWLPQETILFEGARLARTVTVDLAADATMLFAEAVIFGRTARGEQLHAGAFHDSWRVRREGRLVFAEESRGDGDIAAQLARRASLAGGCAAATLVYVAPDASDRLERLRVVFADAEVDAGTSERDGVLVARLAARDGFALRSTLVAALVALRDAALPKVWDC